MGVDAITMAVSRGSLKGRVDGRREEERERDELGCGEEEEEEKEKKKKRRRRRRRGWRRRMGNVMMERCVPGQRQVVVQRIIASEFFMTSFSFPSLSIQFRAVLLGVCVSACNCSLWDPKATLFSFFFSLPFSPLLLSSLSLCSLARSVLARVVRLLPPLRYLPHHQSID